MSDQSLRVLTAYNELWKPGGLDAVERVIHPRFVRHGRSGEFTGVPAFARYVTHYTDAFPDLRFTVDDWMARGARIAIRYSLTGIHRGSFMGAVATGRPIAADGVAIYSVSDSKLAELWDYLDLLTIAEQLDVPVQSIDPSLSWK
ncbi:MAG: ester cyclase [Catenulispora sp.]|nr:ester cyclase [Catenulispora sp.]